MIKEFSFVSPAATAIVLFIATATVIRPFPSSDLLLKSPSPLSLLSTHIVIVWSGCQPPLLLTPSPVITEFVAVFSEDLSDKLSLTRDIQHAIEIVSGASLSDLPHYKIDHVKHIELERQVDEL